MTEQEVIFWANPYKIKGRRHITALDVDVRSVFSTESSKTMPSVLKSPEDTFSLYSTCKEVIVAQGPPDARQNYEKFPETYSWYVWWSDQYNEYTKKSYSYFKYPGKYRSYLCSDPLRPCGGDLTVNSSGVFVWSYGSSKILFGAMPDCDCDECIKPEYALAWFNAGELNLTNFDKLKPLASGLNYGMTIEGVLQSQGNPVLIIPESVTHKRNSAPQSCDFIVDCASNLDVGTLRFYYGTVEKWYLDRNYNQVRFKSSVNAYDTGIVFPSEVVITPSFQIRTDVEFAKQHKKAQIERIEQTVLSFADNGDLNLAETTEVENRKFTTEKESKIRSLALTELQELFKSIQSRHESNPEQSAQDQKVREEKEENKKLNDFFNETVNTDAHNKDLGFELFCKKLLGSLGWKIDYSSQTGFLGSDPLTNIKLVIQCKYQDSVSSDVVIQAHGIVAAEGADKGVIITTGTFTADARVYANKQHKVVLIDGTKLRELSEQYLET